MRKNILVRLFAIILMSLIVGIYIGSQTGCERKKTGPSEVVGFPQSFADLIEKVKPAVVNVSTTSTVTVPGSPFRHFFGPDDEGPFGDFFKRYFGDVPDRKMKQSSLGSGFIIDKDGFIITNNHVVEGADEIKVKLADGREFKARVVGRDPKTDLALIKISSVFKNLPVLPLGDSDRMRVGDWVLAMGNPFGLEHTVTQGILSATGRVIGAGPYDNFLQTDAPINPGNSGGPLINLKGEVIGINSAIVATGQGIGFAIPSNMAKTVVPQLREKGKVTRGWLGVSIQSVTPEIAQAFGLKEPMGALVGDVVPGGPAEAAGIKRGDIIVSFDGRDIKNMPDLSRMVAAAPIGKTVAVKVIRSGKEVGLKVTVTELTEDKVASQGRQKEGRLGLAVDTISPRWMDKFRLKTRTGVVVVGIAPDGAAAEAGIQPGDIILEVNNMPVRNMNDYREAMGKIEKRGYVLFLVKRGAQTFYVTIQTS
ncbi:MAG: DegQ family serine endoprotease [Nitrospirae bacterium]|nr:DegQ family serine endoprotease [Nitrospirota bacterium]